MSANVAKANSSLAELILSLLTSLRMSEGKRMGDVVNHITVSPRSTTVDADDSTEHNIRNDKMSIQRVADLLEQAAEVGIPNEMFRISKIIKQMDRKQAHELLRNASSQEDADKQYSVGSLCLNL